MTDIVTANEAHVRAVAEALAPHVTEYHFGTTRVTTTCSCGWENEALIAYGADDAADKHLATVAVATLTPLIAAEVRAEVAAAALAFDPQRDDAETWDHGGFVLVGDRCPGGEGAAIRWALHRFAARIATEETP